MRGPADASDDAVFDPAINMAQRICQREIATAAPIHALKNATDFSSVSADNIVTADAGDAVDSACMRRDAMAGDNSTMSRA